MTASEILLTNNVKMIPDFAGVPMLKTSDVADAIVYIISTPPSVQVKNSFDGVFF